MPTLQCRADMSHSNHTIHIHAEAPVKVPVGSPCNGCGVCCVFEPCPLGTLLTRERFGACEALRWEGGRYRCGALVATREVLARSLPRGAQWLAPLFAPVLRRLGGRWIAAGSGCDSSLEAISDDADGHATPDGSTTMEFFRPPEDQRATVRHLHHD